MFSRALSAAWGTRNWFERQTLGAVVDELSWCELSRRLRVHACTAKRWAIDALRALAMVWRY